MHIPESVYRSEVFPAPATPVFVAEIACIMCTAVVGTAIDTRWPPVHIGAHRVPGITRASSHRARPLAVPGLRGQYRGDRGHAATAPP